MRLFVFLCALFLSPLARAEAGPVDGQLTFAQGTLHAQLRWLTPPHANREAVLAVQWRDAESPVEPPGKFSAQLWMPSMGHGSSPVSIQRVTDEQGRPVVGAFRISRMFFVMDGDWEVRFTLTRADGGKETVAWPLSIGGGEER